MKFTRSLELLENAKRLIPGQSQTFSKNWRYYPYPVAPVYLHHGLGSHVWDVDGNEFIDFVCGLGAVTLGYQDYAVDQAIKDQLRSGIIFSLPHPLELTVAEKFNRLIPSAEMVRFVKTGSEATQAAIRIARAFTSKNHIAFRGYHGWHEWYACASERSDGIPPEYRQYMHEFKYNDIESLREVFRKYPNNVAAVIMEPMIAVEPKPGFLNEVRQVAHDNEALLILDEAVTGFRVALGGAQTHFKVTPDISTFCKGVANGLPLGVICGQREIMQMFEIVFVSGTMCGEVLSLAAASATISKMIEHHTIDHCWIMGEILVKGLRGMGLDVVGLPCRPAINSSWLLEPKNKTILIQELIKRGILLHSNLLINLCYSHTVEEINIAVKVFGEIITGMKENKFELEGQLIVPAFRRI